MLVVLIAFERSRERVQFAKLLIVFVAMVLFTFEMRQKVEGAGGRVAKPQRLAREFWYLPMFSLLTMITQEIVKSQLFSLPVIVTVVTVFVCLSRCVLSFALSPLQSPLATGISKQGTHHHIISPSSYNHSHHSRTTARHKQHVWQPLRQAVQGHPGRGGLAAQTTT
jgi:hypothetical protein